MVPASCLSFPSRCRFSLPPSPLPPRPRRLVLPYVRHLKGEDDKPLPPSKPRKQYKVSKGTETGEKSKRARKEKGREQVCVCPSICLSFPPHHQSLAAVWEQPPNPAPAPVSVPRRWEAIGVATEEPGGTRLGKEESGRA